MKSLTRKRGGAEFTEEREMGLRNLLYKNYLNTESYDEGRLFFGQQLTKLNSLSSLRVPRVIAPLRGIFFEKKL